MFAEKGRRKRARAKSVGVHGPTSLDYLHMEAAITHKPPKMAREMSSVHFLS